MFRALAKGAALAAFGHAPGGPRLYRALTRGALGTYATHVDKLARVWPGYVGVWTGRAGVRLEGARIWSLDAGETPFTPLASYLLTGRGGVATNRGAGMLDRYLVRARKGALAAAWPAGAVSDLRRARVDGLRFVSTVREALAALAAQSHADVAPFQVPLADASVDLCHSGGALEHYTPDELDALLAEMRRVVRPGGVVSHVVDHRDHLHHADHAWPFLAHLAVPDALYAPLAGHALGYHNRLSPTEVLARFVAAGFRPLALRRLILPEHRWCDDDTAARAGVPGLRRARLAARFRTLSEADLRTAAAHVIAVRV